MEISRSVIDNESDAKAGGEIKWKIKQIHTYVRFYRLLFDL